MASYPARLEIFFGIGDFGWSTDHYYYSPISTLTDNTFTTHALTLVQLYANCLAYGITVDAARASLTGVWRDSVFFAPPKSTLVGAGNTPPSVYNNYKGNGVSSDPFDGINFRLEMGPAYRASEILGGLPAGSLTQPSIYPWSNTPFAATYTQIQELMQELTGTITEGIAALNPGYWGGYVRAKGADGPLPLAIGSISTAVDGSMTVATIANHGLFPGMPVRILGVQQPPNVPHIKINGTWNVVTTPTATTITITNPAYMIGQANFVQNATLQAISLVLARYNKWDFVNQTHRKRGRRFGAPRGRSKRRAPGAVV
jgi:hypothetical protein